MLHRFKTSMCLAGLLALSATTVLAADQTTVTPQTAPTSVQPAAVTTPAAAATTAAAMNAPAATMDPALAARYQDRLSDEMRTIAERYQNVRQELQDEYDTLRRDREQNSAAIFDRVRELKENHERELAQYKTDYATFEQRMKDANIAATDKRFIDESNPFTARRSQQDSLYNTALASLQRLYRLNDQRYNELLRIHEAKENLEEQRYREERDLAADRVRLENRAARANVNVMGTPAYPTSALDVRAPRTNAEAARQNAAIRNNAVAARQTGLAMGTNAAAARIDARMAVLNEQEKQAKARYDSSLNALDDLKDMIENRISQQRDYLTEHQNIIEKIANDANDPKAAAEYAEDLHNLREKRDSEERQYEANLRYLQERLGMEQLRNRELAQIDTMRARLEARNVGVDDRVMQQRAAIVDQLAGANLTEEQRRNLEAQRDALEERIQKRSEEYDNAIKMLDERRKITEKAMDQRLAYLKDRNDLRVRIADSDVSGENLAKFRDEINQLEEKRLNDEREVRNELVALQEQTPATMRRSNWFSRAVDNHRERRMSRLDSRVERLKNQYEEQKKRMDEQIADTERRLNDQNLSAADRADLETQINQLKRMRENHEKRQQEMLEKTAKRREVEEARLNARQEYLTKRTALMDQTQANNVSYEDIQKYNQQIADLDNEWDAQDRQFRSDMEPLSALLPDSTRTAGWEQRSEENWQSTVREAEQQAAQNIRENPEVTNTRTVRTVDSQGRPVTRTVRETSEGGFMGRMRWLGAVIRDGYHDAVDYFTD